MTELERIERLEKLYEKVYQDYELLSIYIPRLTDILIKYWGQSASHRGIIGRDLVWLRDFLKQIDEELQEHFKGHSGKKSKYTKQPKSFGIEE